MQIGRIAMTGAAELDAMLTKLSRAVATDIGEKVVKAGADVVKSEWVKVAPIAEAASMKHWTVASGEKRSALYGHGRDQIAIRKVRPQKENAVVAAVHTGKAFWLHIFEFGSVTQPPRPTFRPAVERVKEAVVAAEVVALKAGISKAIGKEV